MTNKIEIDIPNLMDELLEIPSVSMHKPIKNGVLPDGRNFQVQVVITTDEDEFIEHP